MRHQQQSASELANFDSPFALAYAPLQTARNKSPSRQRHVDSQSQAWTSTTQDPYYSNEDIEILHEIVSIAQEKLEDVSGTRPLPAAALFNAYDEVLPQHGIDPDDENHLSRLIFRIGGEKGIGSLPEKFQAVLASMGISLEYGDNSPASQRAAHSLHSSLDTPNQDGMEYRRSPLASPRPHGGLGASVAPVPSVAEYGDESMEREWKPADGFTPIPIPNPKMEPRPSRNQKPNPTGNSGLSLPYDYQQGVQNRIGTSSVQPMISRPESSAQDFLEFLDGEEDVPIVRAALPRPPLLAILDRWRTATKSGKIARLENPASNAIDAEGPGGPVPDLSQRQTLPLRQTEVSSQPNKQPNATSSLISALPTHRQAAAAVEQESSGYGEYTAMLNRAGRAREIYLASRTFNHWAERTAARLEKEAVARRHMIRFRCFRGWSNAPNSRSPAVDHLRAVTAVQKLRRAVACQEEQLRAAASAIYETNRIQKAKRAMCQWLCSTAQQGIQRETVHRARRGMARSWNDFAFFHKKHAEFTAKNRQHYQKKHMIHHWASKAQQAERQFAISKHIGLVRPMFAHLAAWWDHAEIEKRAEIYRANLTSKQARLALDNWNLRARAQACVWRSDYQSASSALSKWTQIQDNGKMQQSRAAFTIERCQVPATLSRVDHFVNYVSKLEHYAYRARLFIMASKLLRILDHAHEVKKASRKEEIRQQLRARYKEVSSARKKRQFQSALESWRASARRHASVAAERKEHLETQTQTLRLDALKIWLEATGRSQEQRDTGQRYAVHYVLNNWGEFSGELAQQDAQSWDVWIQRKQRQSLKSWSISSLQGSGRAHTAAMVQQRHETDQRNRAFQLWRHSSQKMENTDDRSTSATPHARSVAFHGRRSWRTQSSRKQTMRHEARPQDLRALNTLAVPLDTPTRWTGRPLVMPSTLAKPAMPPVREADEHSATASSLSDEAEIGHDVATANTKKNQRSFHRSLVLRSGKMASTTPQAPVPRTLHRTIPLRDPAFHATTSTVSEQPFQLGRSLHIQKEASEKRSSQLSGPVDSAIRTSLPGRSGPLGHGPPTLNWRGPATPSRPSVGNTTEGESGDEVLSWPNAAKTAPQPSRFAWVRPS